MKQLLPMGTRLGPVHLAVTDRSRAHDFWTATLGLTVLSETERTVSLGAGDRELVVLYPGAVSPVVKGRTGLYHLAIHVPRRKDLARLVARLFALRYPNSPTDHTASETTYLSDPDGNGIELTLETPERGELTMVDGRPVAITADGTMRSGVEALDIDSLLGELSGDDRLDEPIPAGAKLGHVHLHVTDVDKALAFYRDVVGFQELTNLRAFGMADMTLDPANVPHMLAVNGWAGPHAAPAPPGSAGLRHFTIEAATSAIVDEVAGRLQQAGSGFERVEGGIRALDPSSNAFHVLAPDGG